MSKTNNTTKRITRDLLMWYAKRLRERARRIQKYCDDTTPRRGKRKHNQQQLPLGDAQ
jgi:hypothetical protein